MSKKLEALSEIKNELDGIYGCPPRYPEELKEHIETVEKALKLLEKYREKEKLENYFMNPKPISEKEKLKIGMMRREIAKLEGYNND